MPLPCLQWEPHGLREGPVRVPGDPGDPERSCLLSRPHSVDERTLLSPAWKQKGDSKRSNWS